MTNEAKKLIKAAEDLSAACDAMTFDAPVAYVYNPLDYARESHFQYLERYGNSRKRFVLLGMNPGPWGMVQTGVPFGEIDAVKGFLDINTPVGTPSAEHPKRVVTGFDCKRSEVSGRRLWGLFQDRFGSAGEFFKAHFVANYCPLAFLEDSGRNRTPDKLKPAERKKLFSVCDNHLIKLLEILQPEWAIGVGQFAQKCMQRITGDSKNLNHIKTASILHPSPASPAANRDWAGTVTSQLVELSIW